MDTKEKIALMNDFLANNVKRANESQYKVVKSDRGLIERTESSKTILTEDNKEMLFG